MEKTLTKREVLNYLIENYGKDEIVDKFAKHEIELLDRKNSNRGAKVNEEDTKLTDMVVNAMKNMSTEDKKSFTVTEILNYETLKDYVCESTGKVLSTSKLTSLLQKETKVDNARIVNVKDKKNSFYSLV